MRFYQYIIERNIVNLNEIDSYLNDLSKDTRDQRIKKWINSNLRKYLLNQHDEVSQIHSWNSKLGKKPSWFDKALERRDKLYEIRISPQFKQKIDHIIDYFEANPNLGLKGITVSNALKQADEWVEILNKRASKDEGKIEEIEKDGSFIWVKVLDDQALNREGKLMQHCVGSYADKVRARRCEIYSLRDSKNGPHVTIEIIDGKINQIKGKQNAPVVKKYMPYVKRFIKRFGVKSQRDLIVNGLIEINGIIYSFDEIPKDSAINGDLNLKHTDVKSLPKELKVGGNLDLFNSNIEKLSDNLKVEGNLNLSNTRNLKSLPKGLKVRGNLYLFDSNIEKLSDNLKVGGNLNLSNTRNLKSLPKGLKVGGNLNLSGSNIEKLSDNLKVGGNLNLLNTRNLKSLPKGLKVRGNLYLNSFSGVKEIPDDAIIKGKIVK